MGRRDRAVTIVYCGCWINKGHYCWDQGMKMRKENGAGPWRYLDSEILHSNAHGLARITHLGGWTALGIGDRSVDSRGGSHSTFALSMELGFEDALEIATRFFPEVIVRIGTIVQEVSE